MAEQSQFYLSGFISEVTNRGLAKPNRFEIEIARQNSDDRLVSLFCEISNLPGVAISSKGLRIYGPAYQRPISAEFGGEAISMTFYVDRDFHVKKYFDDWMFRVVNPNSYNVQYEDDYKSDIRVKQLNENNEVTYSVILKDAFPKAITPMDLNMASDNQVHKLIVTFGYRKWTTVDSNNFSDQLQGPMAILKS